MKIYAIITAGGTSSRYGSKNKLLEKINKKTVIEHTVNTFLQVKEITKIIICANSTIIESLRAIFKDNKKIEVIEGGDSRQKSVYNGLEKSNKSEYVLIHDGARPMIDIKTIEKTISEVKLKKAITVATRTTDTIKQVNNELKIIKTLNRNELFNTQTPQAFEYKLIMAAHNQFKNENFTDDAGMVEAMGKDVYIVEGDYKNIKITTKNDLEVAKTYLN